jgi:hypothetical protein
VVQKRGGANGDGKSDRGAKKCRKHAETAGY